MDTIWCGMEDGPFPWRGHRPRVGDRLSLSLLFGLITAIQG